MDLESINQHSPWWSRIIAILLGLMVLGSIGNVFYLEIFGIGGINHYSFDNEPENPGDYPHNGSENDQRDYNWSLQEWDEYQSYQKMVDDLEESYATEVSQIFAMLSILIGVPTIAMFWTQNEKMLHFGVAFGATKLLEICGHPTFHLVLLLITWIAFKGVEIIRGLQKLQFSLQHFVASSLLHLQ